MTVLTTLEIGSTITKANAFRMESGLLHHIGQGFAPTSVAAGDVRIGADAAIAQMREQCASPPAAGEIFVNSSAAGGLRMSVHGLTRSMTARAAREAALGAGAIVTMTTVGAMDEFDLEDLQENRPSIILLAGGVDDGEKRIVVENAKVIASAQLGVPVVYAGNSRVRRRVEHIFVDAGQPLTCVDNVFPDVDVLRVEPVRAVIHDVFNDHITAAPGMHGLAELTNHEILPTPGAVLLATELFADAVGDAVVVDVGGATTDVHSVTDGSSYSGNGGTAQVLLQSGA
ncbi:MAG: glutamate mutase L, partial [Cutibacterium acnes]|nr:glutamate mutase L [Cutibacterium acnes]